LVLSERCFRVRGERGDTDAVFVGAVELRSRVFFFLCDVVPDVRTIGDAPCVEVTS
jgi:hypothetical protein